VRHTLGIAAFGVKMRVRSAAEKALEREEGSPHLCNDLSACHNGGLGEARFFGSHACGARPLEHRQHHERNLGAVLRTRHGPISRDTNFRANKEGGSLTLPLNRGRLSVIAVATSRHSVGVNNASFASVAHGNLSAGRGKYGKVRDVKLTHSNRAVRTHRDGHVEGQQHSKQNTVTSGVSRFRCTGTRAGRLRDG
jgi:hypothetical protein